MTRCSFKSEDLSLFWLNQKHEIAEWTSSDDAERGYRLQGLGSREENWQSIQGFNATEEVVQAAVSGSPHSVIPDLIRDLHFQDRGLGQRVGGWKSRRTRCPLNSSPFSEKNGCKFQAVIPESQDSPREKKLVDRFLRSQGQLLLVQTDIQQESIEIPEGVQMTVCCVPEEPKLLDASYSYSTTKDAFAVFSGFLLKPADLWIEMLKQVQHDRFRRFRNKHSLSFH